MMCESCASKIRTALENTDVVENFEIDIPNKSVTIHGSSDIQNLIEIIQNAGFTPEESKKSGLFGKFMKQ